MMVVVGGYMGGFWPEMTLVVDGSGGGIYIKQSIIFPFNLAK